MQREMNMFELICFSTGQFQGQVVCLSYESIYSYYHIIENELQKRNVIEANILIDQLLVTGNNRNRFVSVKFSNGVLNFSTAVNVDVDSIYRQFTANYLKNNKSILENSVLTSKQISMIEKGILF